MVTKSSSIRDVRRAMAWSMLMSCPRCSSSRPARLRRLHRCGKRLGGDGLKPHPRLSRAGLHPSLGVSDHDGGRSFALIAAKPSSEEPTSVS